MSSDEKQQDNDFAESMYRSTDTPKDTTLAISACDFAVNGRILMEGRLKKQLEEYLKRYWVLKWYILRRETGENGRVNLNEYDGKPSDNNNNITGSINISDKNVRILVIPDAETRALGNGRHGFIPMNVGFTADVNWKTPYSFVIETKGKSHVFSAMERETFIKWIRILNRAMSYENPFQMVTALENLCDSDVDKERISSTCSFLIDNYCDSSRVHLIPMNIILTGKPEDTKINRVLRSLQESSESVNMGWDCVATAVEQQIDHKLGNFIRSVSLKLGNLGPDSADFLIATIKANTKHAVTLSEKEYFRRLISRITQLSWTATGEIALSIHSHRGHFDNSEDYHPRNLLAAKGTESWYISDVEQSSVGDWIIFEIIKSENKWIPQTVVIQNSNDSSGVKSIDLSMASESESNAFEQFAVLHDIQNVDDVQYLDLENVTMNFTKLWKNDYKFIKLTILENWDDDECNMFQYFAIWGVELRSDVNQSISYPMIASYVSKSLY